MRSLDRWDKRPWAQRAGDALSQLVNVWLANGMPDESLSGRSWRNRHLRRWRVVGFIAELIFWPIDRGEHCRLAYDQDISRAAARLAALRAQRMIR